MSRIGLLGSYGGLNVGDEAILTSMVTSLRETCPFAEIVVLSRDAGHTRLHHPVDRVVDARSGRRSAVAEEIAQLDLLVLGGGGLLYDTEAAVYLREVRLAQEAGVPTIAYAIGAGPLRLAEDRACVRDVVSRMARVTVRDEESKRVLEDVGVGVPIEVVADPALLLTPEPFPADTLVREGVPTDCRLIGMSVREVGLAAPNLDGEAYHALLAAVADFMIHRYSAHIVFVPMERGDVQHSHAVLAHMAAADRARVLNGCYGPRQVLGLMAHLDFVVGMRLHLLIFAGIAGVPFLPLPYAGKVFDFARVAGVPALQGTTRECVGPLLATLDRLWDERVQQGEQVRARLGRLQPKARRALDRALELLSEPELPTIVAS
jgi:polysaccharide pyruvyl transferase CsaB